MKITIEGNTVDGSARSTLNIVLSGARGPAGEPSPLGVPYTGATQDVNLGEFGLLTGNVEFDTTPTNAPTTAGSMSWNDTDGTVNLVLKGGNVISKLGETQHIRAYNNTGTAIARGKVVYVSGAQGQRLTVALADADTEILSKDTIGFTAESIADGAEGFVIIAGVLSSMNTSGMSDGATVYLSQTLGGYTTTPPVDPAHLVILGFIVNGGSGGAGSIYVKVDNGYELEELHGVADAAKVTPVAADALLLRDSADNNLWKRLTWTNALAGVKTHMDTFKGVAGGYASLDGGGKIPSTELPSYVDDVIEAASFAALPVTGETGKIYVTLDTNKVYRWTGSVYVEVSAGGASAWGAITGTLSNQTDLQSALDGKQDDIILTTTGTSGAATLVGSTLNIPQYQGVLTNPVTASPISDASQIAFFNGGNSITGSSNLFWSNANIRLGIGTNTPTGRIHALYSNFSDVVVFERTPSFINDLAGSAILRAGYSSDPLDGGGPSFAFQLRSGASITDIASFGSRRDGANNSGALSFATFASGVQVERMRIRSAGNVLINNTDGTGRLTVRGSGTTSATTALLVQNSTPSALMSVLDNGNVGIATATPTYPLSIVSSTAVNHIDGIFSIDRGTGYIRVKPGTTGGNFYPIIEGKSTTTPSGGLEFRAIVFDTSFGSSGFSITARRADGAGKINDTQIITYITNFTTPYVGVFGNGNMVLRDGGTFTDNGQRLQVIGSTLLRGSGTTSATTALLVQNSTPTELFKVADNGAWNFNGDGVITGSGNTGAVNLLLVKNSDGNNALRVYGTGTTSLRNGIIYNENGNLFSGTTLDGINGNNTGTNFVFLMDVNNNNAVNYFNFYAGNKTNTSGVSGMFGYTRANFSPTSGTGQYNGFNLAVTINQTGGANGITRGLYVNPTLTAAADWRGIESVAASNANHTLLKLRNATVDVFTVKSDSKIGFFNATPVAQPTTGIAEATFVENSGGTAVNVDSTFAGYTIQQIAQALKDIGLLA